jgi:hypothetical protein
MALTLAQCYAHRRWLRRIHRRRRGKERNFAAPAPDRLWGADIS